MKYKIIAFLMLVPLVLMVCVFSVAKAVSLQVPIAVTGVSVANNRLEVVDIATNGGLKVLTTITPTNATNKTLYYSSEGVVGEKQADVIISSDGVITPLSVGLVKIKVTSADGGYGDSFLLSVTSKVATEVVIQKSALPPICVGDEIVLNADIYPKMIGDAFVVWSSSDPNIADINAETGNLTAKASGEVTITARVQSSKDGLGGANALASNSGNYVASLSGVKSCSCNSCGADNNPYCNIDISKMHNGNHLNNKMCNIISSNRGNKITPIAELPLGQGAGRVVCDQIKINILPKSTTSPVLVNGKESGAVTLQSLKGTYAFVVSVDTANISGDSSTFGGFADLVWQYNSSEVESVVLNSVSVANGVYAFSVSVSLSSAFYGETSVKVGVKNASGIINYCEFKLGRIADLTNVQVQFSNFKECIKINSSVVASLQTTPADALPELEVRCIPSSPDLVCQYNAGRIVYKASRVGTYTLAVSVLSGAITITSKQINITALNPPTSLNFADSIKSFGIENLLTVASTQLSGGEYVDFLYNLNFVETGINYADLSFAVDNKNVARVDALGNLSVLGNGIVTVTAKSLSAGQLGYDVSASLVLRCVEGVNVADYPTLMRATADKKAVVLQSSIDLGEQLISTAPNGVTSLLKPASECAKILKSEVQAMPTTFEWNYYKYGKDYKEPPNIYYCVKFASDVFGNGYSINANNITNIVDGNGNLYDFALFRGGLDFVAVAGASVKGQDNVAFVVDDGVTLNNVELIGANLAGGSVTDLNKLRYVGTVVEVVGDNVSITNCRIKNGRNVVRVYGDDVDDMKKINVSISSSILSYAREFIVKLGTNAVKKGEFSARDSYNLASGIPNSSSIWGECSPQIGGLDWFNRCGFDAVGYGALVGKYRRDDDFNALVKTELTLKNVVLSTSGLFSVGVDCRFAGPALDGGKWNSWDFEKEGWVNIAGTAYPTRLNIEGNFKVFDWKNISNIDSSTLIEGSVDFLKFDLREMIKSISKISGYENIILSSGGEDYAFGGIAMFGGGKNYCLIDAEKSNAEQLPTYSINFDDLKSKGNNYMDKLKMASGKEDFRFFMYNSSSEFNLNQQQLEMGQDITKYLRGD